MKLYWFRNSPIPELQGLSEDQRRQLWASSYQSAHRTVRVWVSYGLLMIVYGIGVMMIKMDVLSHMPKVLQLITVVLVSALIALIQQQYLIRMMRPFMATQRATMEQALP